MLRRDQCLALNSWVNGNTWTDTTDNNIRQGCSFLTFGPKFTGVRRTSPPCAIRVKFAHPQLFPEH